MACYFGVESPLLRVCMGSPIPDSIRPRICDAYGIQLGLAMLPGGGFTDQHDTILDRILKTATEMSLATDREPRAMFASVIPAAVLAPSGDKRLGIIPDFDARGIPGQVRGAVGSAARRFFDVKTLHRATKYYGQVAARFVRAHAVQARAVAVPVEYAAAARRLDETHHGISREAVRVGELAPGPIVRTLRALPTVIGLVFGSSGEASDSVHDLISIMATRGAQLSWRSMGARTPAEARGFLVARIRRDWGITAVRAHAQLLISRRQYVGLSREQAAAAAGTRGALRAAVEHEAVAPEAFEVGMVPEAGPMGGPAGAAQ